MSYNYTQYINTLANLMVVPATDTNFLAIAPNIIDDAEQRAYRELDLLNTIVRDSSAALSPNSRNFTFPQHFIVSESLNVFTPAGSTSNRYPLVPVSREFLDYTYPNETTSIMPSVPQYYAMITDQTIIVGPPPDAAYTVEVIGTIRPAPLSASNPTTYLTNYLPDLFLAASMVFASAYQQNFSAAGDNPQQATSWEQHYQALKASADIEELRKKYASQAWTPKQPSATATPPRV